MSLYIGSSKVGSSLPDPDEVNWWSPPADWPDIRKILDEDTENYVYKAILLLRTDFPTRAYAYSNDRVDNYIHPMSTVGKTFVGFKASDTKTYEAFNSAENNVHVWDKTKDIDTGAEFKFKWIIFYATKAPAYVGLSGSNQSFYPGALWVHGTDNYSPSFTARFANKLRAVTFSSLKYVTGGASYAFDNCYDLEYVPSTIDTSAATNVQNMFSGCYSLKHVPKVLDFSNVTTGTAVFQNCSRLLEAPDVIDMPKITNCGSMFYGCSKLKKAPSVINAPVATAANHMFCDCRSLVKITHLNIPSNTRFDSIFQNCYSLEEIPVDSIDVSKATNVQNMFSGCYSLRHVPKTMDVSKVPSCNNLFYNCNSLVEFPDVLDFRSCAAANNVANVLNALYNSALNMPTHVYLPAFNFSLTQWLSAVYFNRDSFAEIDSSGNVIGGFVYNLNSISSVVTLTIHSCFKNRFTTTEQAAIAACLTNKGWTVSW